MRLKSSLPAASAALVILLSACSRPIVDQASLRAGNDIPSVSVVEENVIPYRSGLPRYVIVVDDLGETGYSYVSANNGTVCVRNHGCFGGSLGANGYYGGQAGALRSQMMSALAKVGNFAIADPDVVKKRANGTYDVTMRHGEVGPFIIKGNITELNEAVENSDNSGFSLGPLGLILGIAGAATGKPGIMWPGAVLAGVNPGYESHELERTGVVALDLQIFDGRTMRMIDAFPARGTFKAKSASSGFTFLWSDNTDSQFAQSALGQAVRAAIREATAKTYETLSKRRS